MTIDPERAEQFRIAAAAKQELLDCASREGIPLHGVEYVVPFGAGDFSLDLTLFYETNADLEACSRAGQTAVLQDHFRKALVRLGYPAEWQLLVSFALPDSHENVVKHYEGSYFSRMR